MPRHTVLLAYKEKVMLLRKSALAFSLAAGAMGVFPLIATAQEKPVVEIPNAKFNFVGEINATSVNVRSGPADSYYQTMKLTKGDKVIVVGHKFDWLKIVPPEGSFSYIAKVRVVKNADGTGTVNGNDVLIKAGSSLNSLKLQPQTKLDTGATVTIIGEAEEFYKIKPPADAYLYVSKRYVDPVRQAATGESLPIPMTLRNTAVAVGTGALGDGVSAPLPAATDTTTQSPTGEPAGPQDTATDLVRVTPSATHMPGNTAVSGDAETQFRKLEAQLKAAKAQPIADQPVDELLKGYQALAADPGLSSGSRRMAKFQVAYLTAMQQTQSEIVTAKKDQDSFAARQAEIIAQRGAIESKLKASGIATYAAVGKLDISSIQKDGRPLLRLTDPADGRTLVYIKTDNVSFKGMTGKFVGVRGEVAKDQQLSVDVIEPSEMEPVDPARVMKGVSARIYPASAIRKAE